MTLGSGELERLNQRLERERRARREAEIIAERGMRELWEANSELRRRVEARTAELERIIGSLEHRQRAHVLLADRLAAGVTEMDAPPATRRLAEVVRAVLTPAPRRGDRQVSNGDLVRFGDELLERWQRVAARGGQLLSVEVDGHEPVGRFDWSAVQAVADTLLTRSVEHGRPGALRITLTADEHAVVITSGSPVPEPPTPQAPPPDPLDWAGTGPGGPELVVVDLIARAAGGSLSIGATDDPSTETVTVVLPSVT